MTEETLERQQRFEHVWVWVVAMPMDTRALCKTEWSGEGGDSRGTAAVQQAAEPTVWGGLQQQDPLCEWVSAQAQMPA